MSNGVYFSIWNSLVTCPMRQLQLWSSKFGQIYTAKV